MQAVLETLNAFFSKPGFLNRSHKTDDFFGDN